MTYFPPKTLAVPARINPCDWRCGLAGWDSKLLFLVNLSLILYVVLDSWNNKMSELNLFISPLSVSRQGNWDSERGSKVSKVAEFRKLPSWNVDPGSHFIVQMRPNCLGWGPCNGDQSWRKSRDNFSDTQDRRDALTLCRPLLRGVCQTRFPPFSQLGTWTFSVSWCVDMVTVIGAGTV